MSGSSGRRAHYINNLNVIPSEHDQEQAAGYGFSNDPDLSFANVDFINWDPEDSTSNIGVSGDTAAIGGYASDNGAAGLESLDLPSGKSHSSICDGGNPPQSPISGIGHRTP